MAIVTTADFVGELEIPNIDSPAVISRVQWFIDKYEADCEDEVLGFVLAKSFRDGLLLNPIAQEWLDLRDGVGYTYWGTVQQWKGIKPMLVNYIYYYWMKDGAQKTTGFGTIIPIPNNAAIVSPSDKMIFHYNAFVRQVRTLANFLKTRPSDYVWDNTSYYNCLNKYTTTINPFGI